MHHAKAVGYERVGERGQLGGKRLALGVNLARLASVEAHVLKHRDVARLKRSNGGRRRLANQVVGQGYGLAEQFREPRGGWGERVLGLRRSGGPPKVSENDDRRPSVEQALNRGHRGAHAAVVGDGGAVERHVEVRADQHLLAGEIAERVNRLEHHFFLS